MDLKLKGKKALVFGSSGGIGKAIAQSLLKEGARVLLCSRTESSLQKTAEEIKADGYVVADLSKAGEAQRATAQAIEHLEGLDILIANTGGPKKGNFMEISNQQWLEDYQSLWLSVTDSIKTALPEMQKQQYGRIVLVTSIAAKEPLPGLTTSNGLRAGLAGLVASFVQEYAKDGITANLILPGYTNTDRLKALNLSDETVKQLIPAERLGEPSELGDLATFLSSPLAGYITGQSIAIDGGVLKSH